jgi:hypothetical protein
MFKLKKSKEVEDFAIVLAADFSTRCPLEQAASPRAMSVARAIDDVCNRAAQFQRDKRLGLYGKAKFGTEFKLKMKELGYPADFVDELTTKLLINMSGK